MNKKRIIIKNNTEGLRQELSERGYKIAVKKDGPYLECYGSWVTDTDNINENDKDTIVFDKYDFKKFLDTATEYLIIYKNNLY